MTEKKQVYKCNVCGNIVGVLHTGAGELVCCGQTMELQKEKNQDEGLEKHVPVVEKTETGIIVRVGEVAHPMEKEHHIEWIEATTQNQVYRKMLEPGREPQAEFCLLEEVIKVRAYCNIHGLWSSN